MPRIRAASIDEHKRLTRREILAHAEILIAEAGTAEISLGDLAASAGIGRTTLYEYFADRDDVIASLVEDELPGVINELIERVSATEPVARLTGLVEATVYFVVDNAVMGLILHTAVPRLGPIAQTRIRVAHADLASETARAYIAGVGEGSFRPLDPELAGRLIQEAIMSAAKTIISRPSPSEAAPRIVSQLVEFLLAGLRVDTHVDR